MPQASSIERRAARIAAITTLAVAALILVLSLVPLGNVGKGGADIFNHLVAYAVLAFPSVAVHPGRAPWIFLAACTFGGAIELMQPLTGRTADWHDLIANLAGPRQEPCWAFALATFTDTSRPDLR